MKSDIVFTSESVCAGHPDKICDQISDAILDEVLKIDKNGRVAVETLATKKKLVLAGEVTVRGGVVDYERIARREIARLGYRVKKYNFDHASDVVIHIHNQSPEIAAGVDKKGAGDQGMMFGFACNETSTLMPLPIIIAHDLARKIDTARERSTLPFLRPDGKTQVSIRYEKGKPKEVTKVVLAVPHEEKISLKEVKDSLYTNVVVPVLKEHGFMIAKKNVIVNGTGVWHIGGPASDTGLTGRKIIVDTYGGYARVGGGCFSGKDPTKVDRSGAYAARFLAKNIVAQKLADRAEVRLAYFIGAKKPLMQDVETFGTEKTSRNVIHDFMKKILDTSVEGIIQRFNLLRPIYLPTAAYGHFGREEFPWEELEAA